MKYNKNHWDLLAGLTDEDDLEESRYVVSEQIEDQFDSNLKESSYRTNLLLEYIPFDPSEDGEVHSDHSEHPEDPNGFKYVEGDATKPDEYDDRIEDEHEYAHAIKIGQIKVKEDFNKSFSSLVNKYALNEDWKEQVDLPGELYDIKKTMKKVPQGVLDTLAAWKGKPGSATYMVLSGGAKGVPAIFIKNAIKELDKQGMFLHSVGHLSAEEKQELIGLIDGLTSLVDESPDPLVRNMGEAEKHKKEEPELLLDDDKSDGKDMVAAIAGGKGLIGVSSDPNAVNVPYWHGLADNVNWELVWLNDVPSHVAEELKNWQQYYEDGREAMSAVIPYLGNVIADQAEADDMEQKAAEYGWDDDGSDEVPRVKGSIEQYF